MQLATKQLRMFPRIQRKYNVSVQFLKSNSANIRRFLWYIMRPRSVITRIARRKVHSQRVVINYSVLRRAVWHQSQRQRIKLRKRSVQQWSKRMVMHLRVIRGVHEHVEESLITRKCLQPDEVSKQLKEQLELLRSGKRNCVPLIQQQQHDDITTSIADESLTDTTLNDITILSEHKTDVTTTTTTPISLQVNSSNVLESVNVPEKSDEIPLSISGEGTVIAIDDDIDIDNGNGNQVENCFEPAPVGSVKSAGNFLDMLMSKVGVGLNVASNHEPENESSTLQAGGTTAVGAAVLSLRQTSVSTPEAAQFTDSSDEFLGFDEDNERLPGMLMTPRVPAHNKSKTRTEHVAFISESLDEYMRENALATGGEDEASTSRNAGVIRKVARKFREANHDGLVTPECRPPPLEMPAVPESLQRLRTVAERRQYLQRFSKNHKLAIINNEAMVYRELQRKMKPNKLKCVSQQLLQAIGSQMPFTRAGWQAAAFVTTEYNRYYYQKIEIYNNNDAVPLVVKLPGVRGNNEELYKKALRFNVSSYDCDRCPANCIDALLWRDFKPIKTVARKAKLNKAPLTSVFKPCPLSQKPFQKPLDDETAALLLAGGSMAVVRMPAVELEVFPQIGKPLHEIAKRYLQYILPHHDITREWAEFSVSTLQQPHTMKEAEAAAAEAAKPLDCGGRRKSFTFAIPYLNDRNQILVRRVVDRSEKLDQSFELAQAYDDGNINTTTSLLDLSFRADIDASDEIQLACADVVSDMINCVAISCSENSFIKDDPDNIYATVSHNAGSALITAKTAADETTSDDLKPAEEKCEASGKVGGPQHKKQNRLLMELRRLNATIIDAATKAEKAETKPCQKPYCALGCICSSLTDDMPLRQHCGKSKCVIECTCKHSNQGRVMRLETDGRSITTEDAFMLRRKATARLARMEKEFTSTIVLTENETLLINESQYDKKRRCTKAPKRYEDFADTDDDYTRITPPKKTVTSALVSIEAAVDTSSSNTCFTDCATELREPIFVRDTILNELKHCSVVLSPLEDSKNMAVWCMVHELYKCYCGGRALEGKPLLIEKDEVNGAVTQKVTAGEEQYVMVATTSKARYSFDKHEKSVTANDEEVREIELLDDGMDGEESDTSVKTDNHEDSDVEYDAPLRLKQKRGRGRGRSKRSMSCAASTTSTVLPEYEPPFTVAEQINSYLKAAQYTCRRCVMVPRKAYLEKNRERIAETRVIAAKMEDADTRLLLNEHILRSVYYHKTELERQRQQETAKNIVIQKQVPPVRRNTIRILNDELKPVEKASCSFGNDAMYVEESTATRKRRSPHDSEDSGLLMQKRSRLLTIDDSSNGGNVGVGGGIIGDFVDLTENFVDSPEEVVASSSKSHTDTTIRMPKITSCFSMHKATSAMQNVASSVGTKAASTAAFGLGELKMACNNGANSGFRDFYNTVIRNMNNLVGKKMQDIDLALRRESKVIPKPNEEILCIIKWTNFLDAYIEGFVYIWEIKMSDHSYFVATIKNSMPVVATALGVVNITALDAKQLPLMGRMLTQRCRTEATRKLAIVMQGRSAYWLVRGFLRADSSQACVKPTPQSHPLLSTKINLLCSLLIKQRMKEYKRKANVAQQQQTQAQSQAQGQPQATSHVQQHLQAQQQHPHAQQQQPQAQQRQPPQAQQQQLLHAQQHQPLQLQQQQQPQTQQQPPFHAQQMHTITQQPTVAAAATASATSNPSNNDSTKTSTTAFLPHSNSSATLLGKLHAHGYDSMRTNIEFRKLSTDDVEEIHPPEYHADDHRWLVLDLHNDFSHIFVPDFRDLVSLDRIHKVMAFSQQRQKIVKLQFIKNAPYDAFVTPNSSRKIYFGPLKLSQRPPLLILLQSVDGQMMLREIYQRKHNIQRNPQERTTALWILQIGGQIHFELHVDDEDDNVNESETVSILQNQNDFDSSQLDAESRVTMEQNDDNNSRSRDEMEVNDNDSDDEDCMIVEPSPTTAEVAANKNTEVSTVTAAAAPVLLPAFTSDGSQFNVALLQPTEAQSLQASTRINFTIERMEDTNKLQITPLPSLATAQTSTVSTQQMPHGMPPATNALSYLQPAPTSGFLPLLTLTTPTVIPNVATSSTTTALTPPSQETTSYVIIANESNPTILPANDAAALQLSKSSANININQNIDKIRIPSTASALKTTNSTNATTMTTSDQLTKPITKRRRTLMSSLRNTNSDKTSNCNISTIGATTITKLTDESGSASGSSSVSPTNINGNKLRSFASITVAKVPTGKGATSTDTVPVTLNLKDALANAAMAKTPSTTIKRAFAGATNTSTVAATATATATLSNSINPTIAVGMQSSYNAIHKVVTSKAMPPSSSIPLSSPTTTTTYTLNSIPVKSQSIIATKHIHILPAPKRGTNIPSKVLNSSGIMTTATTTNPITTSSLMTDIAVSTSHNTSSGTLISSGGVNLSGTKTGYSLPSGTRLLSMPATTENPTTSKRVAGKVDANAVQQGGTMRPLIRIRSALRTNEGPPAKVVIGRQTPSALPTMAATTTAAAITTTTMAPPVIPIAPSPTNSNNKISEKTVIPPKTYVAKSLVQRKGNSNNNNNNNSPEIPTVGTSSTSPAGAVSYGYFHANISGAPKFVVRRQNETYLVKVRDVGIVQIQTAERVNAYLNRYVAKTEPNLISQLPINWRFVPQNKTKVSSNEQQKQQHELEHQKQQSVPPNGNNSQKSIKSNSTSVVLRKILPCTTNTATTTTTTKSIQINSNSNSTTMTTTTNRNVVNGITTNAVKANRTLAKNVPTATDTIIIE